MRRHRIWYLLNAAFLIGGCGSGSSQDAIDTSSASRGLSGAGDGPDLVVTSISAPPSAGGVFDLESTVCNQGTQMSEFSDVRFYASDDRTITGTHDGSAPPDRLLGSRFIGSLAPGTCDTAVTRVYAFSPTGAVYLGAIVDEDNTVAESVESNNHLTGPLIGIGWAPDLVVTSVSGPASAEGPFRVSATVCNQGTLPSVDAEVRFYASTDATITGNLENPAAADRFLDAQVVDPLSPGQCATATVEVASPGTVGAYYLGAIVNEDGAVFELIGSNNHATGPLIGLGHGPDLVVTSVSGPPSAAGAFHIDATVCNQGTQASAASAVRFYASADPVITGTIESASTPDVLLAESAVGELQAGECAAASADVTTPPGPGGYYLGAIVDEAGTLSELIETNNHTTGALIGLGHGPDLVVTALSGPPSTSGEFPIAVTVCNQGTEPSPLAEVVFYLSPDPIITGLTEGSPHDMPVGTGAVKPLQPGECDASPADGWPPNLVGSFYLGAIVDEFDQAHELIESNNHSAVVPIGLGNGADLVVTALSGPPSANGLFQIFSTVCNQGSQPSGYTEVSFYVSQDATITPVIFGSPLGDWWVGERQVRPLSPGECDSGWGNGFWAWVSGTYYLGAIVDQANDIPELNESNNTFTGAWIGLGNGPDLVVASVSGPPSANGAFHITSTVCNQGTQPSPGATVQFYASADTTITGIVDSPSTPDAALGSGTVGSLQPGQCDTASGDVVAPAWTGAFYLGAIVDEDNTVPELIEGNNHTAGARIGLGDGPDLVASVSGPPSADGAFHISSTVCNQGTQPSAGADVRLYASADTTITGTLGGGASPDVLLAVRPVDALQPGQCDTASTEASAPAWTGAFHLGAIVDEGNAVAELIESNNQAASAPIGFGAGPDLVVTSVSGPPVGQDGFSIASTVCNQGTQPSPGVELSFYASLDTTITTAADDPATTDLLVATRLVGPLAPGQCDSTPASGFMPPWYGTYYLGAVVDEANQVAELIESNNRALGPPIVFGFGPDLLVTAVSGPPSASGSFEVVSTVCNQGTEWSYGFVVRLYASADPTITGALDSPVTPDLLLGERYVGWLDAGQCDTASVTVAAPGVTGAFYLGATVDEDGYVIELIESNNHTTGAQIALGDGALTATGN